MNSEKAMRNCKGRTFYAEGKARAMALIQEIGWLVQETNKQKSACDWIKVESKEGFREGMTWNTFWDWEIAKFCRPNGFKNGFQFDINAMGIY